MKHEPAFENERFVGNTDEPENRAKWFAERGVPVRIGAVAFDIDGKALPDAWRPMFTTDIDAHHAVMMRHTFGPHWRDLR